MPDPRTEDFLHRFAVTPLGGDQFTCTCNPGWPGKAFGGQLAAQSLQAAAATAPAGMVPWSLHMYFHAPVRANERIDMTVERIKDGRTTATRQVRLHQDGSFRMTAMAAFGMPGEGPRHQWRPPEAPAPELVPPLERIVDPTVLPAGADHVALGYPAEALIEMRMVESAPPEGERGSFERKAWMRVLPEIPDDPLTTATTLCYLADITLGTTALEPHGGRAATTDLQLGAIELTLWFTGSARLSDWCLFSQDSSYAGGGHGLSHGAFHSASGDVVAIAVQNALMRSAAPPR
ncbi:MAG: acyl-CoA thioesterase [Candidatus Nanopelagicales bacterium]